MKKQIGDQKASATDADFVKKISKVICAPSESFKEIVKQMYLLANEGKFSEAETLYIFSVRPCLGKDANQFYVAEADVALAYVKMKKVSCTERDALIKVLDDDLLGILHYRKPNCVSALMLLKHLFLEIETILLSEIGNCSENDNEDEKRASSLARLAHCQYHLGELDSALVNYNKLINDYPKSKDNVMGFRNRAEIKRQKNDLTGALEDMKNYFERLFQYFDDKWTWRCQLGFVLQANIQMQVGDWNAVLGTLQQTDGFTKDGLLYYNIQAKIAWAKLKFKLGEVKETEKFLADVFKEDPNNSDALQCQGEFYLQLAINNFAQVFKMKQSDSVLKEKLGCLYKVAEQPREIIKLELEESQRIAKTKPLSLKDLTRHTILFKHDEVHQAYKEVENKMEKEGEKEDEHKIYRLLMAETLKNSAITKEHIAAAREMNGVSTDSDTLIDTLNKQLAIK